VFIRTTNPNLPKITDSSYGTKYKRTASDKKYYGYNSMHLNPSVSKDSKQPFPMPSLAFAISRLSADKKLIVNFKDKTFANKGKWSAGLQFADAGGVTVLQLPADLKWVGN